MDKMDVYVKILIKLQKADELEGYINELEFFSSFGV